MARLVRRLRLRRGAPRLKARTLDETRPGKGTARLANGGGDWSRVEVEATVASYLNMLSLEIQGIGYNKSKFRRELKPLLQNRSDRAIEDKHMNMSAVLIERDYPHIDGYKPYYNYQRSLLPMVVEEQLAQHLELAVLLETLADAPPDLPSVDEILKTLVDPPERRPTYDHVSEPLPIADRKTDYLVREARNRALGVAGELFVVDFERARLIAARQERLAAKIEHVSASRGDGAGFDVLSFEVTGQERLVEVKTTRSGKHTPFFVSANEVAVSRREFESYNLYRVFSFALKPRLFIRGGAIDHEFSLTPEQYVARV